MSDFIDADHRRVLKYYFAKPYWGKLQPDFLAALMVSVFIFAFLVTVVCMSLNANLQLIAISMLASAPLACLCAFIQSKIYGGEAWGRLVPVLFGGPVIFIPILLSKLLPNSVG